MNFLGKILAHNICLSIHPIIQYFTPSEAVVLSFKNVHIVFQLLLLKLFHDNFLIEVYERKKNDLERK